MGAFIIAAIILFGSLALAFFVAFGEGMASAPQYDDTPRSIVIIGCIISLLLVASHWFPHIGW